MTRRIVTAREQVEAWQIKELIPSDFFWLEPEKQEDWEGDVTYSPTEYERIPDPEQAKSSPPSGKWYHVSQNPIDVGTRIVPAGGESPDPDFYDSIEEEYGQPSNRQTWVWIAQNLGAACFWSWALNCPYIYKVHPNPTPQPWNFDGSNGYVCDSAKVEQMLTSSGPQGMGIKWDEYEDHINASRIAAEPGGRLPYQPSEFGYVWYHDGDGYTAVTRDGKSDITLIPNGSQIDWEVWDDQGLVERGNFSGMVQDLDGILYRADHLLAEFDENPAIPAKGFGYDKDYSEQFPSSFPALDFRQP